MTPYNNDDEGQRADKHGGWSVAGTLTATDTNKTFGLSADFDEPGDYTVQFGTNIPGALGTQILQAEAEITWMVAGNSNTRRVTISNGCSVSGTAEAVRVVVRDVSTAGSAVNYDIGVTVAKGTRANVNQPPLLYPPLNAGLQPSLAIGVDFDVTVPVNAGVISAQVLVSDVAGGIILDNAVIVSQLNAAGVAQRICDPRTTDFIPLGLSVVTLRVRNRTNAAAVFVSVVFAIDG